MQSSLALKISRGGGVWGNTTQQEGVFEETPLCRRGCLRKHQFSLKYGQIPLVEFVEESGVTNVIGIGNLPASFPIRSAVNLTVLIEGSDEPEW